MLRDFANLAIVGAIIPPNANPGSTRGTLRREYRSRRAREQHDHWRRRLQFRPSERGHR
jgi:hypothetical protein